MSKYLALVTALLLGASVAAHAATMNAIEVTQYPGDGIRGARADGTRAFGAADGRFMSLGLGGAAVFRFAQAFTGSAAIHEVTFGTRASHLETARVFVAETFAAGTGLFDANAFREIGRISNASRLSIIGFDGTYRYLALLDTSPRVAGRDGFDIDAISVTAAPLPGSIAAVPLPATAPLMLLGMAALAWTGRRRAS